MSLSGNPPIFDVVSLEAHQDGDRVMLEGRTEGRCTLVLRFSVADGMDVARQLQRAYHQQEGVACQACGRTGKPTSEHLEYVDGQTGEVTGMAFGSRRV